ncbi:MAG: hypothetical protein E7L17_14725 [Clostridium sp.]|uniref:hypothetical protein n=1 Tax=Clostridium sp. TaxID=1506 RepID=UPI002909B70C|nr:hypothetical protein [Clostridium sp.]MDU7339355.1 hypothetical protein [Clostridium sp.]
MSAYNIQNRLEIIGKKQADLLREINVIGVPYPYTRVDPGELSRFINGISNPPKSDAILAKCDEILTKWEDEIREALK